MPRICLVLAALSGALGVVLSALAAHGDEASRDMTGQVAMMSAWHAPAFLGLAALGRGAVPAALWGAGLVLFGGAVLARAHAGLSLGPVAPVGGALLVLGWLALGWQAWRH